MTWADIGRSHLAAAKALVSDHPRSSVSRAYYAAHVVLSEALLTAGYVPPKDRETPPHDGQVKLIGVHLGGLSVGRLRDLRRIIRRTYRRRIDADYRRSVTVASADARDAVRDVSLLFLLLGTKE
jgi:uncharacterized protein (UPF0332 family)